MSTVYQIEATTEDGQIVRFPCRSDEDVISAAVSQDIYLMSSCREGGCATCKSLCTDGDYDLPGCSAQALPTDEEEDGYVLLCRTFPRSDLSLELPYTYDRISFGEIASFEAGVLAIEHIASNAVRFVIEKLPDADGDRQVRFDAGQFFELTVPGAGITRSYSPANLPNRDGVLEFLIRILPDGRFSRFLTREAAVGQHLQVRGSSGIFGLKQRGFTPRYFVAGGTGLAPVVSMLRHMRDWKEPHETRLYFGVNRPEELFYVEELRQLEREMDNLSVNVCVWQGSGNDAYRNGSVVDVLREDLDGQRVKPDLYLCGPPGMVDAVFKVCSDFAIPAEQIFLEKFLPSGVPVPLNEPSRIHA